MGYDIIRKLAELSVSDAAPDVKLKNSAALLCEYFQFDQCLVYAWDNGKKALTLKAASGINAGCEPSYSEAGGLPGLIKSGAVGAGCVLTCVRRKDGSIVTADGAPVEDAGLSGYGFAALLPFTANQVFYGVLYLKAKKKPGLDDKALGCLETAGMLLSSMMHCAELDNAHRIEHDELLRMRSKLIDSEKIMALGDMAANLAHEVKNPLLSIGGFAARLKKHIGKDSPGLPYLAQMSAEILRLEKIIDGVVRFLKDSEVELHPEDINGVVEEALEIFSDEAREAGINIEKEFYGGALVVEADREQLKIAFDNLIANALQSMEKGEKGGGGVLRLATSLDGNTVAVSVSDSGGGIDPEQLRYIFSPFFTTKKHGSGLGLPITNSIIMRHKGALEVHNEYGVGATFTVKLRVDKAAKQS
ncbi:MAG: hypothetical protein HY886_09410 [Deltaproteobacteria bacterium]|nr:hypothetical protein [Deltaproteobacteria bacterium]